MAMKLNDRVIKDVLYFLSVICFILFSARAGIASDLLADSDFSNSMSSSDLRADGSGQDWYESYGQNPGLLSLNEDLIGDNNTKKAKLEASDVDSAYFSQEFNTSQTGTFTVQWNIYVDNILEHGDQDRSALMMIGDDSDAIKGPNSVMAERFVVLALHSAGGGGEPGDTMSLIACEPGDDYSNSSTWKVIATGLSFDAWHKISVTCDVPDKTYNVYVDDVLEAENVIAYSVKESLTHISFAQLNDSPGTFYVDNVEEVLQPKASFFADVLSGTVPLKVDFADLSTGSVDYWDWSFGDGGISFLQNPEHIYHNPGLYTVSLNVAGLLGSDDMIRADYINVLPIEIIDDNTGDNFSVSGAWSASTAYPGYLGSNYRWKAKGTGAYSATWYFDVTLPGTYKVYAWWSAASGRASNAPYTINHAFGSTTVRVNQLTNGAQWNELCEVYFDIGRYSVVLSDNADGNVIADGVKITYVNDQVPPAAADFSADKTSGSALLTVQFSEKCTGAITSYLWNFGDGNSSTDKNPIHIYDNPGTYDVTLSVNGPGGSDVEIKSSYIKVSDVDIIIDNSNTGFTAVAGSWPKSTVAPGYYGSNYQYNSKGTGTDAARWTFGIPKAGNYKVYAWWSASTTRASNAPYTINNAFGSTTFRVDQRANGGQWNELGQAYFQQGSYSVVLNDNADNTVIADAIRVVYFNDQLPAPDADFTVNIRKGLSPLTVQFTDQSTGNISYRNWDFGDGSSSSDQNPAHTYASEGIYSVKLTVRNKDAEDSIVKENYIEVYESAFQIDNKDDSFKTAGSWIASTSTSGYWGTNYSYSSKGTGSDQATWNFNITKPGTYRISAWWTASSTRATNAPYKIYHAWGDYPVRVNQLVKGSQWNTLGEFYFTEGSYSVVLTDAADGTVIADAIKIEFLYMEQPALSANFMSDITSGQPSLTVHFEDQSIGNITAWEWNFGDGETSSVRNPAHTYQNNGIYSVTLTVHDSNGSKTITRDEYILVSDVNLILDNTNSGFSVVGTWGTSTSSPGYYGSNYRSHGKGTGNNIATWSFTTLKPGTYRVYAWWSAAATRASNSPYIVNHAQGGSTVKVDQRINGGQWNKLGDYYFEANNYSVKLTDNADATVVADAVRIVFINDQPPAPKAEFSADNRFGMFPLTVHFTDQSGGYATSWEWDFGNGQTSFDQNPVVTYAEPGTYSVTLTATGPTGADAVTKGAYIVASDTELVIDNSGPGFSTIGTWSASKTYPGYYGSNYQSNTAGLGNDKATWSFDIPKKGTYKVYAWWSAYSTRASNAPYTINNALGSSTVQVNQRVNGGQWNELGDYYFENKTNSIVLTDKANGTVVADAVRLLFISELPPPPIADFKTESQFGEAPFVVQFIDQSTGFISSWHWDFGDYETSTEQNPQHTYTNPGIYSVTLRVSDPYGEDTITKQNFIIAEGGNTEAIFAFFTYSPSTSLRTNTINAIEGVGAIHIKDNVWFYNNTAQNKMYKIQIISGFDGTDVEECAELLKEALRTENAHIIIDSHSNYGSGVVFATPEENSAQKIEDIKYIDDDRILSTSSKWFFVPISDYVNVHAFPNWQPLFKDGAYGIMPYVYNDPEFPGDPDNPGVPAFNYYLTYQVPGDPTYYKIENADGPALTRFPASRKPAWYSPDGSLPDYNNPDQQKYFITNSEGTGIRSHFGNNTILFRKDLAVQKEEFKYSRMFLSSCKSGIYYADTFNRGILFYSTATSSSAQATATYLSSYIQGRSDEQILSALQKVQPIFEYYNFNESPPVTAPAFSLQWDIYVDDILDIADSPDRAGMMMIGKDSGSPRGPNGEESDRFVQMAFRKDNGGDTGSMVLEARELYDPNTSWTTLATGLELDRWYTIKVECDLIHATYNVYINGNLMSKGIPSYRSMDTVTHLSFAQGTDAAGTFYVDNVITPILTDNNFDESADSEDLRYNDGGYNWYESRNETPELITLDETNIGGNSSKKAGFQESVTGNAYLTQAFNPPQNK
jgi:PKD repeat protein